MKKREENKTGAYIVGVITLIATILFGYHTYKFAEKTTEGLNIRFKKMDDFINANP